MRRAAHFILVQLGNLPIFVAWIAVKLATFFYVLADRVIPNAGVGNCWSYVLPKVAKEGGYAPMRPVQHDTTLLWGYGVPLHVAHVAKLDGTVEQTEPIARYKGASLLWRWLYFRYKIKGADEEKSPPWG